MILPNKSFDQELLSLLQMIPGQENSLHLATHHHHHCYRALHKTMYGSYKGKTPGGTPILGLMGCAAQRGVLLR